METIVQFQQTAGVFVAGLLARAGLVLAVLALLALPVLLVAGVLRAVEGVRRRQLGLRDVAGLLFRPGLWYAPTHTWLARRPGGAVVVGLDDLAQRLMPSVTGLDLPRPGAVVRRGEPLATVYAGARTLTIPSPLTGTLRSRNHAVQRDPGLVKREPYGRGWLACLEPADAEWASLPRGEAAEAFLRAESARWNRFVEEQLGFGAADGGHLVAPAPELVGEAGWRRLAAAFAGAR
jgi:glycine cleavage system H lipoate-binding protein